MPPLTSMPGSNKNARKRRILKWQGANESVLRFGRGTPCQLGWPAQRRRADESLAVENLRRAYYDWKLKRRKA